MRILMIQRFDLSSVSCARRVICQAEELLRRGREVYLADFVHNQRHESIPAFVNLSQMGVKMLHLDRKVQRYPYNIKRLLQIDPKPDIIHLWKSYPDASLPALALSKLGKIPLHYDWDDWETGIAAELTGSNTAGWIAGKWDRLLPRLCHSMTTASEFLNQKAIEWGADSQKIWDAPVGADLERFYPRPCDDALLKQLKLTKPLLVYSGQLEVASYAEQAVETLKLVIDKGIKANLLVLGGGRKLEAIRQRADDIGVARHVLFTDYVPADEIPKYLSMADIALAPFEENDVTRAKSPLKIAEYMAMGLPIVASDVGDVRRMASEAGAIVPCCDIQAMADKVVWMLNNQDIRQDMSSAGQKQAQEIFNWKSHVDSLETAYAAAIDMYKP